jgi:hypothetical protein
MGISADGNRKFTAGSSAKLLSSQQDSSVSKLSLVLALGARTLRGASMITGKLRLKLADFAVSGDANCAQKQKSGSQRNRFCFFR